MVYSAGFASSSILPPWIDVLRFCLMVFLLVASLKLSPFIDKDNRQAMLNWPRQLPIAGELTNIIALVQRYANWLQQSPVPKLFINAEPGSILVGAQREFCRTWPNQKEVTVSGLHFIQEDSPDEIGRAVADWMVELQ